MGFKNMPLLTGRGQFFDFDRVLIEFKTLNGLDANQCLQRPVESVFEISVCLAPLPLKR